MVDDLAPEDRLIGELAEQVRDPDTVGLEDRFGGGEGEAAAEHGALRRDGALCRIEQVPRRRQRRLEASGAIAAAIREEPEALVEAIDHVGGREQVRTRGGQLDGEGEPIEPIDQLGDQRVADLERATDRRSTIAEDRGAVGGRQGTELEPDLAVHAQASPRRDEERRLGRERQPRGE